MTSLRNGRRTGLGAHGSLFATVVVAGTALSFVVAAQAQTIGLRGKVEEEELAALLRQPSLANRPSKLTAKAEDPEKKADAKPRVTPTEDEEAKDDGANDLQSVFGDEPPGDANATDGADAAAGPRSIPTVIKAPEPAKTVDDTREEAKAVSRLEPVDNEAANERARSDNTAIEPIDNRDITAETDPFAAPGIGVGAFVLRPSLEQGISSTSNASNGSGPALFSETTLRLGLTSNWARHALSVDSYGTWLQTVSGTADPEPKAGVDAKLRLDLEGPWTGNARLAWQLAREDADSATPLPAGTSRPILNELDASLGIAKDEGKARLSARLDARRLSYGDATLSAGGTLSQKERNQTYLASVLRAGYEISPAVIPFAEAEVGRRIYDLRLDTAGYERSATHTALRAGLAFAPDEKFNGEFAAGWLRETFDDSRLAPISGLSLLASANWSPERETTIRLTGSTTVEGTTTAGSSGSLLYAGEVSATRQLRANLSVEAALQASLRDYTGSNDRDVILAASAGFTWWLNRYLAVTGRARHEVLNSTISGNSSRTTSAFLGIKIQR